MHWQQESEKPEESHVQQEQSFQPGILLSLFGHLRRLMSKGVALLVMAVIVLAIGCFMEATAAITISVPILLPIATKIGIDPVSLGIGLILNLMIGLLTPPVGMVLYVLSRVSGVSFERCVVATLLSLVPYVLLLMAIVFIPQLSMWLPTLIYR